MIYRIPTVRHHKAKNLAYVFLDGKQVYLGRWDSDQSRAAYQDLLTRLKAENADGNGSSGPTVGVLMVRYMNHVRANYSASQTENVRQMMIGLRDALSRLPIDQFGAPEAKQYRGRLAASGLARTTANKRLQLLRQMFKWGVVEGMVQAPTLEVIRCVPGFRRGREGIRDCKKVKPVADALVDWTLQFVSPTIGAMIRTQRLSGMRPAEVCRLNSLELKTSGDVWVFEPAEHKKDYLGIDRIIDIGPRAQKVIAPFLRLNLRGPIFLTDRHQQPYTVSGYRRAITRAIERAVPLCLTETAAKAWIASRRWHPNQLRHAHGTEVRSGMGLEAAQHALGHAKADVTQLYAEKSEAMRREVALRFG